MNFGHIGLGFHANSNYTIWKRIRHMKKDSLTSEYSHKGTNTQIVWHNACPTWCPVLQVMGQRICLDNDGPQHDRI